MGDTRPTKVKAGVIGGSSPPPLDKKEGGSDIAAEAVETSGDVEVQKLTGERYVTENIVPIAIRTAVRFLNYMHPVFTTGFITDTGDNPERYPLEEPACNPFLLAEVAQTKVDLEHAEYREDVKAFFVNLEDVFVMCASPLHFFVDEEDEHLFVAHVDGNGAYGRAEVTSKIINEKHKVYSLKHGHGDKVRFATPQDDLSSAKVLPGSLMGCIVSIGVRGAQIGDNYSSLALLKVSNVVSIPNTTLVEISGVLLKKRKLVNRMCRREFDGSPDVCQADGEWVTLIHGCVRKQVHPPHQHAQQRRVLLH